MRLRSAILSLTVSVTTRQVISVDQKHHQDSGMGFGLADRLETIEKWHNNLADKPWLGPFRFERPYFLMVLGFMLVALALNVGVDEPIPGLVGRARGHRSRRCVPIFHGRCTALPGNWQEARARRRRRQHGACMPAEDAGSASHRNFFNTKLISGLISLISSSERSSTCWRPATSLFWHAPLLRLL